MLSVPIVTKQDSLVYQYIYIFLIEAITDLLRKYSIKLPRLERWKKHKLVFKKDRWSNDHLTRKQALGLSLIAFCDCLWSALD